MARFFRRRLLGDEGNCAAGFEHGLLDIVERRKSLAMSCCFKLRKRDQVFAEQIPANAASLDQHVRLPLDSLLQLPVTVEKPNDKIIDCQQRGSTDDSASNGIIVADDGILNGVGKCEQYNQVKGVQLR